MRLVGDKIHIRKPLPMATSVGVSKPYAYKLIRQLNKELKDKGFITIAGRINRQYFNERLYGARTSSVTRCRTT